MNALEWGLIVGVVALLLGPLLALKAAAKIRSWRCGSSEPNKK